MDRQDIDGHYKLSSLWNMNNKITRKQENIKICKKT